MSERDEVGRASARLSPDDTDTGLPWPKSWRGVYWFVFSAFVTMVAALTIFARVFA